MLDTTKVFPCFAKAISDKWSKTSDTILVYTSEYSEFSWATSWIIIYFFFGRENWFFVIFSKSWWDNGLSCIIINSSREIWCKDIFDNSIFNRVKTNDCNFSTNTQSIYRFFDTIFDMFEFFIDGNTKSLEYAFWRMIVITCFSNNINKTECCINRLSFACFYNGSSNMNCFFFISVSEHQVTELIFGECHHEISCRTSLSAIKSHIKRSIKSYRKSTITIIIMSTTHSEIIENKIYGCSPSVIQDSINISKARMYEMFGCKRIYRIQSRTSKIEIIHISINANEDISWRHMRYKHTRMSSKSECRINDSMMKISKGKYLFYFSDEDRIMMQNITIKK